MSTAQRSVDPAQLVERALTTSIPAATLLNVLIAAAATTVYGVWKKRRADGPRPAGY